MQVLVFNRQFTDTIGPYENNDEIEKYKEKEARRKLKHEEEAAKEAMRAQHDAKEQKAEEEVAIVSEKQQFGISLNIMQPILSPVQQNLGRTIVHLWIAKRLVTWEQSRASFWLVNTCVLAGILLVGIPWDFLIHWAFRIAVWIFLGPWMKLVDILFVKGRTREELRERCSGPGSWAFLVSMRIGIAIILYILLMPCRTWTRLIPRSRPVSKVNIWN
jgi:hypothetical protein